MNTRLRGALVGALILIGVSAAATWMRDARAQSTVTIPGQSVSTTVNVPAQTVTVPKDPAITTLQSDLSALTARVAALEGAASSPGGGGETPPPEEPPAGTIASGDILGVSNPTVAFASQAKWIGQVMGNNNRSPSSISDSTGVTGPSTSLGTLRFGKITDPANASKTVYQFLLAQSDPTTASSKRSEIEFTSSQVPIVNGTTYWVAFQVYVFDWGSTTDLAIFGSQLHLDGSVPMSPAWSIIGKGSQMYFDVRYSTSASPSNNNAVVQKLGTQTLPFGQWITVEIQFKTGLSTGFLRAWVNGTQTVNYSGHLGISQATSSLPSYVKFGYYGWQMPTGAARKVLVRKPMIVRDNGYSAATLRAAVAQ